MVYGEIDENRLGNRKATGYLEIYLKVLANFIIPQEISCGYSLFAQVFVLRLFS